MSIGRNDPCACGGGRKDKHCCLPRQAAPTPFFGDDDRHAALRPLVNWAVAP